MNSIVISQNRIDLKTFKGILLETFFIVAAVAIPRIVHSVGGMQAGQTILPMHWTVIMAALVFGWRGGLIAAITVPSVSYMLSGMPLPFILPAIFLELLVYGFVLGMMRDKLKWNIFLQLAFVLIFGRLMFFMGIKLTMLFIVFPQFLSGYSNDLLYFVKTYFAFGAVSGVFQLLLIPIISDYIIKRVK